MKRADWRAIWREKHSFKAKAKVTANSPRSERNNWESTVVCRAWRRASIQGPEGWQGRHHVGSLTQEPLEGSELRNNWSELNYFGSCFENWHKEGKDRRRRAGYCQNWGKKRWWLGIGQVASREMSRSWSHSEHILKVEPTRLTSRWHRGCERKMS